MPVEHVCKEIVLPTSITGQDKIPGQGRHCFSGVQNSTIFVNEPPVEYFVQRSIYLAQEGFVWILLVCMTPKYLSIGKCLNRCLNAVTEYMQNISFMPPDCLKDSVGFKKANFIFKPYQA